jgi:hypothetical protein
VTSKPFPARSQRITEDARLLTSWHPEPVSAILVLRGVGILSLHPTAAVVALMRDDHVVVPRSDTPLYEGDEVVLLVSVECGDNEIRTLLLQGS